MKLRNTSEYREISAEETVRLLETRQNGLTESEVQEHIDRFGRNEVLERERNSVLDFLSRYWGPMDMMLDRISFGLWVQ